jgi:L-lactate dehydrogenase complex protein LldE
MHYNTGYAGDARRLMGHFIKVFEGADVICIPSASCVAMIREHYPKMVAESGDEVLVRKVDDLLGRVFEFTELLVEKLGVTDVGASYPHTVTMHPSCHSLRSLRLDDKPQRLLRAIRGLELVDLPEKEECCGFGGTFSLKNADVSNAMVSDKARCVLATNAEVCTAADNSCLMHIGGALRRRHSAVRCVHLAELLAATEGAGPNR